MNTLSSKLLLALMLLVSQTALVMHDIECWDDNHDQICKIYVAQDHAATNNATSTLIEGTELSSEQTGVLSPRISHRKNSYFQSRAPPTSV